MATRLDAGRSESVHEVPHRQALPNALCCVLIPPGVKDDDPLEHQERGKRDVGRDGHIAEGGVLVLNEALIAEIDLDPDAVEEIVIEERTELDRRVERYRGDQEPIPVADRSVILVDDGLATGYTAMAAIEALRLDAALILRPLRPPVGDVGAIAFAGHDAFF